MDTTCEGYRKLLAAVEHDEKTQAGFHNYRAKLDWVVARAEHYAEKTGLSADAVLDAWEKQRTYWYMNFYQDSNQPLIGPGTVRVFDTVAALREAIGTTGFRCPMCAGVSKSPYECDTGIKVELISGEKEKQVCNWKSYGLFGHLGKGVSVFVKEKLQVQSIFMPVAFEKPSEMVTP